MKKYIIKHWLKCLFLSFLLAGLSLHGLAQTFKVSGTVSDNEGILIGVSVREEGTNNGMVTKEDGSYQLTVSGKEATLIFSFIGHQTETVHVSGRHQIDVRLNPISQKLSNVIVTALGISREKKALGYSVDEITGKEINHVPHENVLTALAGKTPGVSISQTGGVGSSVSIIIRGANSLSNDNQPLFVVDGVPISNGLNNSEATGDRNEVDFGNAISSLNPEDIKSITILKGPSAAALYGSRAGNGVILITTKNGSGVNRLTVTVNSSTVFDIPDKYLFMQAKFGPGLFPGIPVSLTGFPMANPLEFFAGRPNQVPVDITSSGNGGAQLDQGYKAVQWNSPVDADGNPIPIPLVSYPNNAKNFLQTGITSQNGVSVANNTKTMRYRLSYSNMRHRGLIPNTDLFRNTLDLNASVKVNNKVQVSTSINISRNNSNSRPASQRGANPLYALYSLPASVNVMDLRNYWAPGLKGIEQLSPYLKGLDNPWFLAYEVKNKFRRDRLYGNIKLNWQIMPHLSLMLRYGLDTYNEQRKMEVPLSYHRDPKGAFSVTHIKPFESNADFLLTYNNTFHDFNLSASAGGNIRNQKNSYLQAGTKSGTGLIVPNVYTLQNILPGNLDYSSSTSERQVNSLYGMATLGFKDMAYLDVSGRNDWSSTLPNAQPYFYPSASLSLIINEIAGIKNNNVNLIKLRGGIAQVGNDASPYRLTAVLQDAGAWGDVPQLTTSGTLLNPQLKPEKITSYEGGLDIRLFGNRLRLSGTYYMIEDENQIFSTPLPSGSGYTSKSINAGLVRTKGIEGTLGFTPVKTRNWNWDINFNFTRERTRIVKLASGQKYFQYWDVGHAVARTYQGEEVGNFYGHEVRTVTDKTSPYYGWPLLKLEEGTAEWQQGEEWVKIGNYNPDFVMGIQTSLSFKNFSLSMTFDWRSGGQFVSETMKYGHENGFSTDQFKQFWNPGVLSGKALRDYLVAHADELIKVHGNHFPRIGWPTPERVTYPFLYSGVEIPYGALIVPGVIAKGYDSLGNPTGYIENLGENILNKDPNNPNATYPDPYAAANPWDYAQANTYPASYLKLREVSLSYRLPDRWMHAIKLQGASISVYSRNIIIWTKAKIGIDPERAFEPSGSGFSQGIEAFNVNPSVIPIGVKLHVTF